MFRILKSINFAIADNVVLRVVLGICLLTTASKLKLAIGAIPITFQSVAALLIGFIYSPRDALYTVFSWLSLGFVMGLPVFSANLPPSIFQPSAGYLLGFGFCAVIVSLLRARYRVLNFIDNLLLVLLGQCIIYVSGISWLAVLLGFEAAIKVGFLPFILPGIVKCFAFASIIKYIKKL